MNRISGRLVTLVFILLTIFARGQSDLTTIVSKDGYDIRSFQAVGLGDSLFLFYKANVPKSFKTICILPDGTQKTLKLSETNGKLILGIEDLRDSLLFYYLEEEQKQLVLKGILLSRADNGKRPVGGKVVLSGKVFGSYWENRSLIIVSGQESDRTISVTRINRTSIVDEKKFQVLPAYFNERSVAFIPEQGFTQPQQAEATMKIYQQKNVLYLGIDEPAPVKRSVITKCDLASGSSTMKIFFDASGMIFKTFVRDDHVFKVAKDKNVIELSVYNFSDVKVRSTLKLLDEDAVHKESAYERNEIAKVVKGITVKNTIDAWGRPFVVVYSSVTGPYVLKVGDYEPTKFSRIPIVSGFGPIISVMSTTAFTASMALNNEFSVDRYFYLRGDPVNGFNYHGANTTLPDQAIDDYEIALKVKPNEFRSKGYLRTGNFTYAFYRLEKKYQEMRIVKF
jgi:hypothetical protein